MSNKKNNFLKRITRFLSSKPRNQKELIALLHDAQQRVLINRDTLQMFEGVLAVSGKKVRDVMVPRAQMVTISSDTTLTEMLPNIAQSQHSRFPDGLHPPGPHRHPRPELSLDPADPRSGKRGDLGIRRALHQEPVDRAAVERQASPRHREG